jgi:hypothetical protein
MHIDTCECQLTAILIRQSLLGNATEVDFGCTEIGGGRWSECVGHVDGT